MPIKSSQLSEIRNRWKQIEAKHHYLLLFFGVHIMLLIFTFIVSLLLPGPGPCSCEQLQKRLSKPFFIHPDGGSAWIAYYHECILKRGVK